MKKELGTINKKLKVKNEMKQSGTSVFALSSVLVLASLFLSNGIASAQTLQSIKLTPQASSLNCSTVGRGTIYFASSTGSFNICDTASGNGNPIVVGSGGATVLNAGYVSAGNFGSLSTPGNYTFDTGTLAVDASNHRVGVGTTAPVSTFHVNGNVGLTGAIGTTSARPAVGTSLIAGEIHGYDSNVSLGSDGGLLRLSAGGGTGSYRSFIDLTGYNNTGTDESVVVLGTRSTERMRITNAGNVGIGTTAPNAMLDIYNGALVNSTASLNHYRNVLMTYLGGGSQTGTLKIVLPKLSNTMVDITIKGYDYSGVGAWEARVSGYVYSPGGGWYSGNNKAQIIGSAPFNQIRLASDGSKPVILLGTTATNWSYGSVEVTDVTTSYNYITDWGTGWSASLITSETGITTLATPTIYTYITPNGNVGIGTTTPSGRLDVYQGTGAGVAWASGLNIYDGSNRLGIIEDLTVAKFRNEGGGGYEFYNNTAGTNLLDIDNAGTVTVGGNLSVTGSFSPASVSTGNGTFSASSAATTTGVLTVTNTLNAGSGSGFPVATGYFQGAGMNFTNGSLSITTGVYAKGGNTTDAAYHRAYAIYAVPGTGGGNNYAAYFGGSVGIGTTTPAYNLDVTGSIRATTNIRTPIYYDSDNAGYYADPSGMSNLNSVQLAGPIYTSSYIQNSGDLWLGDREGSNGGTYLNISSNDGTIYSNVNVQAPGFMYTGGAYTRMDSNQFYCNNGSSCYYNYSGTGRTYVGSNNGTAGVTINGPTTITGAATLSSTLGVTGAITAAGATINGPTTITGTSTLIGWVGVGTSSSPVAPLNVIAGGTQGIRLSGGSYARMTLVSSDNSNMWNFDNSVGTLRFFRENYNASGAGSGGSVAMSIADGGGVSIPGALSVGSISGSLTIVNTGSITLTSDSSNQLVVGGGTGKIDVGLIDPPYTIGGKKYATYGASMTGLKEETAGSVTLSHGSYVIDLMNGEEGSDTWLFAKTTNLVSEGLGNVTVLLTPSFDGKVWYEKGDGKITIRSSEKTGEVSYRLTAPRFDHEGSRFVNVGVPTYGNRRTGAVEGINLDKLIK